MHRDLAESILRSPRTNEALLEVLRQLPEDIDVDLATFRIMQVLSPTTLFVEAALTFPPHVIARVLAHIPLATKADAHAVFLAEAVRVSDSWVRGLETLLSLGTYEGLEPKKRRSRARVLVKDVALLTAAQAAVASEATNQSRGMLELLAADGSEASVDALLIELERARRIGGAALQRLENVLADGAHTPRLIEMQRALA
ncbi:MAG TPA: hypothetical protein VGE37_16545 [Archangium sp.]